MRGVGLLVALLAVAAAAFGCSRPAEVAQGTESLLNPGQALHCSGIERLSPVPAEQELQSRGYEVSWEYFVGPDRISRFERPPGDAVILAINLFGQNEAHVIADIFDPGNPHHRRIRSGEGSGCD